MKSQQNAQSVLKALQDHIESKILQNKNVNENTRIEMEESNVSTTTLSPIKYGLVKQDPRLSMVKDEGSRNTNCLNIASTNFVRSSLTEVLSKRPDLTDQQKINQASRRDSDSLSTSASVSIIPKNGSVDAKIELEQDADLTDSPGSPTSGKSESSGNLMKQLSPQEEESLAQLAIKHRNNWKKIAKFINLAYSTKYTAHFLKTKHKEFLLKQKKDRVKFSHDEDLQIVKYLYEYGIDWSKIASHFQDRTPVMIKNRYYSYIRKKGLTQQYMDEQQDGSQDGEKGIITKQEASDGFGGSMIKAEDEENTNLQCKQEFSETNEYPVEQ